MVITLMPTAWGIMGMLIFLKIMRVINYAADICHGLNGQIPMSDDLDCWHWNFSWPLHLLCPHFSFNDALVHPIWGVMEAFKEFLEITNIIYNNLVFLPTLHKMGLCLDKENLLTLFSITGNILSVTKTDLLDVVQNWHV